MAKKTEPLGELTIAIIAGVFVLLLDKVVLLDKLTEHVPGLVRVFFGALIISAAVLGRRYYVILGGGDERHGSEEREPYDTLRERLSQGGMPTIVYNRWLRIALEKVDEFFGDAGRKDTSWIARALHLETDGPRWTAPAFDRCLLLALIYPIVTVFAVWAFSGHVGPAERALGLPPDDPASHYPDLWRSLSFLSTAFLTYAWYRAARAEGLKSTVLWGVVVFVVAGAAAFAGAGVGAAAFAGAAAVAGAGAGAIAGAGAVAFAVAFAAAVAVAFTVAGAVAGAAAFAVAAAAALSVEWAKAKGRLSSFLSLFFVATCIACLAVPYALAPLSTWSVAGALLLFYGFLTLVNAPFDWLALGFTRALMRRGLLRGGPWPFAYALIDVLVAAVLIAALAFAMVIAIQTFDDVAVLRGGPDAHILPLGPLFTGLQSTPGDYQYWWVWLLLFSSMIPSILNLSIAGAAFLRGLPGPNRWILARMPSGKAVRERDRLTVAAALTGLLVGGMALTGIATYLVAIYLIPLGLPAFGAVVRDFAADLATYNAPARMMIWLTGGV
jgi:hypothetical protein